MSSTTQVPTGQRTGLEQQVLTPAAREFLQQLHRRFEPTRQSLLQVRRKRQEEFDRGIQPDFLESTREIREGQWRVAPIPADLQDRRVEITGPTDRKMIINALNSGANVFMADFEDSNSPTWSNCLEGQQNLRDAVARTIDFTSPEGKEYRIRPNPAVLFVRPRGWHLLEKHFTVDGAADVRLTLRLRSVLLSQRHRVGEKGHRTLFLSAEDGGSSGGAAVERCIRLCAGICRIARRERFAPRC